MIICVTMLYNTMYFFVNHCLASINIMFFFFYIINIYRNNIFFVLSIEKYTKKIKQLNTNNNRSFVDELIITIKSNLNNLIFFNIIQKLL